MLEVEIFMISSTKSVEHGTTHQPSIPEVKQR